MARRDAPPNVSKMYTIKITNIDGQLTNEVTLKKEFAGCGVIGDVYIPMNLHTRLPRDFAFMRFTEESFAQKAIKEMDGRFINGLQIGVEDSQQGVYFSQDTGHITNYSLGAASTEPPPFDSSMPEEHYKALEAAKIDKTTMHTIRVNNIDKSVSEQDLMRLFSPFGTIGDINHPIDLKTRNYRDFVFIRYMNMKDAIQAAKEMCYVRLGSRMITTEFVKPVTYFSDNETSVSPLMSGIC